MHRELGAEVPGRWEDVGVARDWSLAEMAMENAVETGPIDMKGV